ncbi:MAG: Metal dependent phosphohydrolase [candidate division CPR2 bacterium GW2011_GWC1_41_48]|uniref:Metal dependent phosphohydrolase n=1 Tax=candidate division CPR2 bacterium GW2011_GWC1_41_48 TaxID=1618344 RepID=A0A0G0WCI5_UNCC2|nr:MAG: Metal dependent phosphohydrolase [candidate division CPR2 bacterium GW2011_GWC2_39_35]KKR27456.1 MAG: Metal dependent phosphohydrolase [candidate division CPR2 bacterium GW2011_GWD1_39_7]KKR27465.1 MAG: Metal dependent phosphohydrolase [candidate division CPR2 bacterium GW2011_GWD2_39_7]KKS09762.1 MAG: Metal dependent phosphohydrolase [candidate division CPR2 bacterium GW2011_GWC1_41_48]
MAGQPFVIKSLKRATSKSNKQYIDLELGDKTGSIKGKIWSDNIPNCAEAKLGDVVYVSGNIDSYSTNLQFIITTMLPCDSYDIGDYLEVAKEDREKMFKEIKSFISQITDQDFLGLLENLFEDKEFVELFKKAPAAWTIHHSYVGGLLEHVLDCLQISDSLLRRYPKIRKDILFTGAILHDIGKVFELNVDTTITHSNRGKLLGHIYIGCEYLTQKAPQGFPKDKLDELLHMILSHHGEIEFGSPIRPKTIEAVALWMADYSSFKVNMAYNFIYDSIDNDDQSFTGYHRYLSTDMFLEPYQDAKNE